jgi:hypothetical protein
MRLDDLIREGLAEEAGQARFDTLRWAQSIVEPPRARARVRLRRAPRPPRRWVAAAAVVAVVLAGIGLPLVMLSGLFGADRSDPRPTGSTVTGYGLSLELPAGWEGGVTGPKGSDYGPFLQAANRPLGPPEDDPFATATRRELAPDDVALVLIEYTESLAERGLEPGENGNFPVLEPPISIREGDFQPSFEGVSDLHDFARRTFTINGRSFDLWVEFGQKPAPGGLLSAVDEVLATLSVEPPAPPPGYVTHTDAGDGLAITVPEGWSFSEEPTDPIEPENVLAAGSWPFPEGGVCAPFAALDGLPANGAFFWMIEYHGEQQHPEDFVPRPERFDFADFRYGKEFSCYGIVPQYQLRFNDQGRFFQLQVAFGGQASESLRAEVLRALDSIEVTAPVPDECPADTGPWSDPDCPLPAWTRAVVEEAGYEVTGDTGSALVARVAGSGIYIWTNEEEELSSEPTFAETLEAEGYERWGEVAGRTLFTDGIRAVWVVQGLRVWVAGGPVDDLPELDIVAPLVEASGRVDYDAIDTR